MTFAVEFEHVSRHFGEVRAVDRVDLAIREGAFFAMLGPSGSGKTTCLRLISGFDRPTSGHIRIFGASVEAVPPNRRNVNTVFQDYALFPHLDVRDNVAYGPMVRGVGRAARHAAAERMLALVQLAGFGDRKPAQLSGGQRQRVALARALINEPRVLLLDEPLGALDLKLREAMQDELKALQARLGITFVFVTHDQGEALSMADEVAVFNAGRLVQVGTPAEIYERPATQFVADFVGSSNVLPPEIATRLGGARGLGEPPPRGAAADRAGRRPAGAGGLDPLPRLGHPGRGRHRRASGLRAASRRVRAGAGHAGRARLRARGAAPDGARLMAALAEPAPPARGAGVRLSDLFWRRPSVLLALLLAPPLLWLGVIYLGSLFALLAQSFFSIDEFSGVIDRHLHAEDLCRAAAPGELRHHPAHRRDGGGGDAGRRWSSPSRSPTTPPATPGAGGRRSSTSG